MTDKEKIIIDGVDVSGCKGFYIHDRSTTNIDYWMYGQCKSSKEYGCYCRNNPNCYYKQLKRKEQECERLKWYLKEIRYDELKALDIEWDEYETHCIDSEYSNIINLVEEALKERSSEDCRYDR